MRFHFIFKHRTDDVAPRLLSTMGGNLDRVYTVNPKHMRVNYPRHVSENKDPNVHLFDDWSETTVTHVNTRIRLAEILRETVDCLPLGSGDVDTLSYSKIADLDQRFVQILTDYPPFDLSSLPVDATLRRIALQRAIGLISVQARHARFLRPFIQIKNLPQKFDFFRRQCLKAARSVMELASSVLSEAVDTPGSVIFDTQRSRARSTGSKSHQSPYHSGLIINHASNAWYTIFPFQIQRSSHKLLCRSTSISMVLLLTSRNAALYGLRGPCSRSFSEGWS